MLERFDKRSMEDPGILLAPSAPAPIPKKSIDVWDWIIKGGGVLAGLKTLLELIEKFRKRKTPH
jgi:hypothetical protein